MYLLRRIARCQPGKAWEVAGYLSKICAAYEEGGRNKAQIYIGGQGLPGTPNVVYAEWTQDAIEPNWPSKIPASVPVDNRAMQASLTEYAIEIFEMVTPEKLVERGVNV